MAFDAEVNGYSKTNSVIHRRPRDRLLHVERVLVAGDAQPVAFSAIRDNERRQAACDLLNDRYGWRGYGAAHGIPAGANHTTFAAELNSEVIGTVTLAIDSAEGLAIDRTFAAEMEDIRRRETGHFCELTKLAFEGSVRSKDVLAGLFHIAFIYGTHISKCTDLFIEVHPRHAGFYQAMLGFERLGVAKVNASVGASSQLMHLKVEVIRRNIRRFAGDNSSTAVRSLYPYFLSTAKERRIRRALTEYGGDHGSKPNGVIGACAIQCGQGKASHPPELPALAGSGEPISLRAASIEPVRQAA